MGRKIPAKRHRGVKDPAKQQAQRFESIKERINAPPADPDEQPVPRSLLRLFAFQQPRAPGAHKKPRRPRTDRAGGGGGGGSAVAALRRLPGEAGRAFSLRINSAVRALSHPDDQDYPLDLEETDTRGEYIAAQRERRQRKHRKALAAARGAGGEEAAGRGSGAGGEGERLRKPQRRALKKKEQLKAKEEEAAAARALAARDVRYERVPFGDVAHAPPALPAPRRAAPGDGAPRPGRRDLLLSSMLCGSGAGAAASQAKAGAGAGAGGAGAGAAGALSAVERERRERARLAAVAAYRQLKLQRAVQARARDT